MSELDLQLISLPEAERVGVLREAVRAAETSAGALETIISAVQIGAIDRATAIKLVDEADARVAPAAIERLLAEFKVRHETLHREWTLAVGTPGYVKAPWRDRDNALCAEYRDRATALGYRGPLLPGGAR